MTELLRYHDIELPVYPPEQNVAWTTDDIENSANKGGEFLRRISVADPRSRSLDKLLDLTENIIEEICDQTGAMPVPHKWGLYPVRGDRWDWPCANLAFCYHEADMPPGYHLVAEVESVTPQPLTDTEVDDYNLAAACAHYTRASRIAGRPYIFDVVPRQFVYGFSSAAEQSTLHYIDPEPRISTFKL